ncbi:right-handed parallel beta-helix repeat-containing protein [bacterium]|nr:right-handed parallel beta-helix repeat-containing protein [bacterium]
MSSRALITTISVLSFILPALSATIHVPSEIPTIQAGIMVAQPGDTVLIACGLYGNSRINMEGGITLRSENGDPGCVIIDAWNQGSALICYDLGDEPTRVEGITFCQGVAYDGGGISIWNCQDIVFSNCIFKENEALSGGGVCLSSAQARFENCLFWNNAADTGGAVTALGGGADFINCSFFGNSGNLGAAIRINEGDDFHLENCILMANTGGHVIQCETAPDLACCDLFANPGGNWVGPMEELNGVNGNIGLDPLFCYLESGDFTLQENSPCRPFSPPNPDCGMIGAWPVACMGPTSVPENSASSEATHWGDLKRRFY